MYRFNWEQLHVDGLITKCKELSDDRKGNNDEIKLNVVSILKSTGGLPLANTAWTKAHQEKVSMQLFHEAVRHYLSDKYSFSTLSAGYFIDNANEVQKMDPIDPNKASAAALEKLPVLGPVLSGKIVEDRRTGGSYNNLDELQDRIPGLGIEGAARLEGVLTINTKSLGRLSENFETNFTNAFALFSVSFGSSSLVNFLEELASFTSKRPHPASKWHRKRNELEYAGTTPSFDLKKVKSATIITNTNYYPFITEAIKSAQSSIEICMFFMALGGDAHPNRALFDLLIEKHKSGVMVRVLLDKDRNTDPYGSRIINSKAGAYLEKEGISVRFDQADTLLHSKYVILDNERVVIGSHNWTKGSFYEYDDISLGLESTSLVADATQRFGRLWDQHSN